MADIVKTIGGIISAIITLVVIVPILNVLNSQLQVPNFDILNIVIRECNKFC